MATLGFNKERLSFTLIVVMFFSLLMFRQTFLYNKYVMRSCNSLEQAEHIDALFRASEVGVQTHEFSQCYRSTTQSTVYDATLAGLGVVVLFGYFSSRRNSNDSTK